MGEAMFTQPLIEDGADAKIAATTAATGPSGPTETLVGRRNVPTLEDLETAARTSGVSGTTPKWNADMCAPELQRSDSSTGPPWCLI